MGKHFLQSYHPDLMFSHLTLQPTHSSLQCLTGKETATVLHTYTHTQYIYEKKCYLNLPLFLHLFFFQTSTSVSQRRLYFCGPLELFTSLFQFLLQKENIFRDILKQTLNLPLLKQKWILSVKFHSVPSLKFRSQ